MARYMPQRLFNMGAVTVAHINAITGRRVEEVAEEITESYSREYDDEFLAREMATAAIDIAKFLKGVLPPETLAGNLVQMQFCIKHYRPDGKKIRKRVFSGTWFNSEPKPIMNRAQVCVANIATFHMLLLNGQLPLAPDGWKL